DRRRAPGDADHRHVRRPVPPRGRRLEVRRGDARLPDDQSAGRGLGPPAVLERVVLRRPAVDELKRLAPEHGFSIQSTEEEQYAILGDSVLAVVDALDAQEPAPVQVLDAERDAGRPPRPGEDPYNAIVRWCRVRARGGDGGVLAGKRVAVKDSVA